jgi:CheY-like chemotaxis protein
MTTITVMAIDDDPVNLKLAAEVPQSDGYAVVRAEDAEQALRLLETHMPDLVLTDIAMPGMSGLDLTRRLKTDPRYRHLPVVAMTASAMKGDESRILEAGCDAYLAKPLDTRQLAIRIAAILTSRDRPGGDA